jgi:hypothetical protein
MVHPDIASPEMPSANTGASREIQPLQHLIWHPGHRPNQPCGPESALTLAGTPSIRPVNGGGRNPAAAVL